jgi:CubicO group peptidase (beta-lactamase class C family)
MMQRVLSRAVLAASLLALFAPLVVAQTTPYVPTRFTWETRTPAQVGMNAGRLEEAIAFAKANESQGTRDLEAAHYYSFGREPYGEAIGPLKPRGDMTGIIVRHGYLVAEWGDPYRVDMTFSVTKSFLSTTVGLAYDRGLIENLDDAVHRYVATGEFDSEHNRQITWGWGTLGRRDVHLRARSGTLRSADTAPWKME